MPFKPFSTKYFQINKPGKIYELSGGPATGKTNICTRTFLEFTGKALFIDTENSFPIRQFQKEILEDAEGLEIFNLENKKITFCKDLENLNRILFPEVQESPVASGHGYSQGGEEGDFDLVIIGHYVLKRDFAIIYFHY